MAREVAPGAQWNEPHPTKVAGRAALFFPKLEGDVWGWTDRAADADGIVVTEGGVLGVDDSTAVGGLRVFGLEGSGPLVVIGA